jgi:hypothetical protein
MILPYDDSEEEQSIKEDNIVNEIKPECLFSTQVCRSK